MAEHFADTLSPVGIAKQALGGESNGGEDGLPASGRNPHMTSVSATRTGPWSQSRGGPRSGGPQ
jgi:hypothetical protein